MNKILTYCISMLIFSGCYQSKFEFQISNCIKISVKGFSIDESLPEDGTLRIISNDGRATIKVVCQTNSKSELESSIDEQLNFLHSFYSPVNIDKPLIENDFTTIYFQFNRGHGMVLLSSLNENTTIIMRYTESEDNGSTRQMQKIVADIHQSIQQI